MIDFVSTRSGADAQTVACARLLAAVIARAIDDACESVSADERSKDRNIDWQARQALQFLFGSASVFPLYAELIGSSAQTIRATLRAKAAGAALAPRYDVSDRARRNMQWRLQRYAPD